MSPWSIVVPVWGDRYVDIFRKAALPALRLALARLTEPYQIVLYSDDSGIGNLSELADLPHVFRPVPGPDRAFYSMSNAHRDVMQKARLGDRIVLLTADLVISASSLATCAAYFHRGKRLVCCSGMRVLDNELPPQTESGRQLPEWAWGQRHPMTAECTWPNGHSFDCQRMYFANGSEVACRLILPHPLAVLKGHKNIVFHPTVDVNVAANFTPEETHLVTDPDEVAMIELSPKDKDFSYTETMRNRLEKRLHSLPSFQNLKHPRHRAFFAHKIIICGTGGDCGDGDVVARMLE